MRFIAIIPARYQSTRFPGKPLAKIGEKPMIQHVFERVSAQFADCWVATDDERIETCVRAFGGRVVMTSDRHKSGTDRCLEALNTIEKQTGARFDVAVNVQGDEPFIAPEHLRAICGAFGQAAGQNAGGEVQIATLVKAFGADEDIFNPNTPKVAVAANGDALYFSRSVIPYLRGVEASEWQGKHIYFKHIGLYAYQTDVLRAIGELPMGRLETCESLEQLRWLENGLKIRTVETDVETLSVDTPEDLEKILKKLQK